MSIHADDEFSLRLALESELDDVTPRDGLADLVIASKAAECLGRLSDEVLGEPLKAVHDQAGKAGSP